MKSIHQKCDEFVEFVRQRVGLNAVSEDSLRGAYYNGCIQLWNSMQEVLEGDVDTIKSGFQKIHEEMLEIAAMAKNKVNKRQQHKLN